MVSNTNNTGSANPPQHVVREAQQQCVARPGPQQAYANMATDDGYLVSPGATPQLSCFDQQWSETMPMAYGMYSVMMQKTPDDFLTSLSSPELDSFPTSAVSTPTMMNFQDSPIAAPGWVSEDEAANSRRNSRRISNAIMDRVNKFENMSNELMHQPLTPPGQNGMGKAFLANLPLLQRLMVYADHYPPTPIETPQTRHFGHAQPHQRFAEGYDESGEETVKPLRQRANRRSQTVFDEMRQATEALAIVPEMQRANTMPNNGVVDSGVTHTPVYMSMNQPQTAGLNAEAGNNGFRGHSYSASTSSEYSDHASPAPHMAELNAFDFKSEPCTQAEPVDVLADHPSASFTQLPLISSSQHRRTDSIASLASAASIASIDIEGTKTATGITPEDIQQYMQGPDPKDNKWICVFEDCNKRFGRKENIKSHVQTHLNDRQFKCPECQKCFVRQHDLKRHAKIHTGIKPYPCKCGNTFARHDALTRHRQRGMCIGAFEGSAPKNAKRGRPRKARPDSDERRDKASRTRRKNKSSSAMSSSASSHGSSTCSDSAATSPEDHNDNDDFDMLDDNIMDISLGGTTMNPSSLQSMSSSSAPMPSLSAAVDDHHPLGISVAHSPSAASVQSYASHVAALHHSTSSTTADTPGSPARSVASAANDPPELSHVSSPPATQYFDTEPPSSGLDLMISTCGDTSSLPGLISLGGHSHENSLLLEQCEPQMLMFGSSSEAKFDDSYDGVDLFTNNDELLFGSS